MTIERHDREYSTRSLADELILSGFVLVVRHRRRKKNLPLFTLIPISAVQYAIKANAPFHDRLILSPSSPPFKSTFDQVYDGLSEKIYSSLEGCRRSDLSK